MLMDSPQSVVSPFKTAEPEKHTTIDYSVKDAVSVNKQVTRKATNGNLEDDTIGVLQVYVHQARDIHNICIYHKQDVYAKICLTSDPDNTVSTNTINGGGRNPVFNQSLQINVKTVDCSLKCEIFMMSRVKNYLEDQLLGFALVPLSQVLMKNGQLENDFSLSSTDLFHSPAGYVKLSLSYSGATPEVMSIPALPTTAEPTDRVMDECELQKLEFPDPNIVNENKMMVSEYFGMPCSSLDSETSESLVSSDADNHTSSTDKGTNGVESISTTAVDCIRAIKLDSPPSSVSTNGVASPSNGVSSNNSEAPVASKTQSEEHNSVHKELKRVDVVNGETDSSTGMPKEEVTTNHVFKVNIEPEQNVVQQDIVDMYMKSMQQFTDSLAKMKLPLEIDNSGPASSGSSNTEQKTPSSTKAGSRVFYGSRAFF
ncbi:hypothetical protein LINPERPRIM_LOCUS20775 [Linum perenne]